MNARRARHIRQGIAVFRLNWPRFTIYSPGTMPWRVYATVAEMQHRARNQQP